MKNEELRREIIRLEGLIKAAREEMLSAVPPTYCAHCGAVNLRGDTDAARWRKALEEIAKNDSFAWMVAYDALHPEDCADDTVPPEPEQGEAHAPDGAGASSIWEGSEANGGG